MSGVKNIVRKLFGEDIDLRQRIINILSMIIVVLMVPTCIVTAIVAYDVVSLLLIIAISVTGAISLYVSNKFHKVKLGAILLIVIANFILLPLMFFKEGGRFSGMPIYMVMGAQIIWLLLDGVLCYVLYGLQVIVLGLCYYISDIHPEYVTLIDGTVNQAIDTYVAGILTVLVIGAFYKFHDYAYRKACKELEANEKKLKDSLEELACANEAKSNFLKNMSHEIRTPINAILGMNEMIKRESLEENILGYAQTVEKAGTLLLAIINDVIDVTKIETHQVELNPMEYQTASLLTDCYSVVESRAKEKNLEVIFKNNPYLPTKLYGDEVRVRQILINILSNSVKYTMQGSVSMTLDFTHDDESTARLRFIIKDTGVGISEDDLQDLVKKFERVQHKENSAIQGVGLGLVIAKSYVDLMGGSIKIESNYGVGTTVIIEIPQKIIDNTALGNMKDILHTENGKHKKYESLFVATGAHILSVDDVKMNHDVLKMLLKESGVTVDTVFSGIEAVKAAAITKYDLILMDHMMPDMDGIEALREIKQIGGPNKNTPVIALTANAVVGARKEYLDAGFVDYITKPVRSEELERKLMQYLPENLIVKRKAEKAVFLFKSSKAPDKMAESKPEPVPEFVKTELVPAAGCSEPEVEKDGIVTREDFEAIGGIDMDYALECCADSIEIYVQAVLGYIGRDNRVDMLQEFFENRNWADYRVNIHAVKSSSLLIGLKDLSAEAKALELATAAEDYAFVESHHEECLKHYRDVVNKFKTLFDAHGVSEE